MAPSLGGAKRILGDGVGGGAAAVSARRHRESPPTERSANAIDEMGVPDSTPFTSPESGKGTRFYGEELLERVVVVFGVSG